MEINNTDVENLSAWIASQNDELERLRAYMLDTLIHGYSAHDAGVKHGFMVFNGEAIG